MASTWNGWPPNFSFTPSLRSSPVCSVCFKCAEAYKPADGIVFQPLGKVRFGPWRVLLFLLTLALYRFKFKKRQQLCRSTSFPYFIDTNSTPNPLR